MKKIKTAYYQPTPYERVKLTFQAKAIFIFEFKNQYYIDQLENDLYDYSAE